MKIRKKKGFPKLNLNSVMDAIFIFIFFLLMSAQFINIHVINSDAPAIALVKEESKDEPLNLVIEIHPTELQLKTGLDAKLYKKLPKNSENYDTAELRKLVIDLKRSNLSESTVTFKPHETIAYNDIVKVIDAVRELKQEEGFITGTSKKGEAVKTQKLFDQVVFETMI